MIELSIALVVIAGLAYHYFNKKLMLEQPVAPIPLNERVEKDLKILQERITTIENVVGMTVRR